MGSDEVARIFAANLARHRKRAGLSQEEVGFRASLHRTEINRLESGARVPRLNTVVKLADALEAEIPELVDGLRSGPAAD